MNDYWICQYNRHLMCKSFFLLLGSTYPKAWINLPHSWGKLSHIPYFFKKPTTLLWQALYSSYCRHRWVNTSYIICNTHFQEFVDTLDSWSILSQSGSTYPGLPYSPVADHSWHSSPPIPSCMYSVLHFSSALSITLYSWAQVFEILHFRHLFLHFHSAVILPFIHTHVFCLSPIDFHPSSLKSISPALQFLFYMCLALAADHNVIGKHHGPWSFLSDLIRHPIHHHCKQTRAQTNPWCKMWTLPHLRIRQVCKNRVRSCPITALQKLFT